MFRTVAGTRLIIPEPALAWLLLALGLALIVWGTLCAMKIRRAMNDETGLLGPLINEGRSNLGYLLNDYDGGDKPLLLFGLVARLIGGVWVVWAGIALFVS